jgi:hypothetical protein
VSNRSVYEQSVANAQAPLVASNNSASLSAQESINAVGVNIGANTALGVTAAHDLTIRQANAAYIAAKQAAASTQMQTIQTARDLLASQGDTGPK